MKNILITGGLGFIGKSLIYALHEKYNLFIVDKTENKKFEEKFINVSFIKCDIRNYNELFNCLESLKIDGVIHLAAISRVIDGHKNPELCNETNVIGTENILSIIGKGMVKPWIIFSSSREVYGESKIFPVEENFKKNPINIYGVTKLKGVNYKT